MADFKNCSHGIMERLEAVDDIRDISDAEWVEWAARIEKICDRFIEFLPRDERDLFENLASSAASVQEHLPPQPLTAEDRYWQGQDTRRGLMREEAVW